MRVSNYDPKEVAERAKAWYEAHIKALVEPAHDGEVLIINAETGEFFTGRDRIAVSKQGQAAWPDAPRYLCRVGLKPLIKLGPRFYVGEDGVLRTRKFPRAAEPRILSPHRPPNESSPDSETD